MWPDDNWITTEAYSAQLRWVESDPPSRASVSQLPFCILPTFFQGGVSPRIANDIRQKWVLWLNKCTKDVRRPFVVMFVDSNIREMFRRCVRQGWCLRSTRRRQQCTHVGQPPAPPSPGRLLVLASHRPTCKYTRLIEVSRVGRLIAVGGAKCSTGVMSRRRVPDLLCSGILHGSVETLHRTNRP